MPYRRSRRYARRRTPYWNKMKPVVPNLGLPGQPNEKMAHLRFVTHHNQAEIFAGAQAIHPYFANRLSNPDSGNNRDALGLDQYMGSTLGGTQAMYNRYIVVGAKIYVQCILDNGTALPTPIIWGVRQETDPIGTNTTWHDEVEDRRGTWQITNDMQNRPQTAISRYSAKRAYGSWPHALDMSVVTGRNNTPVDPQYFVLWYQPVDQNDNVAPHQVRFVIIIDFAVLFFEPQEVFTST